MYNKTCCTVATATPAKHNTLYGIVRIYHYLHLSEINSQFSNSLLSPFGEIRKFKLRDHVTHVLHVDVFYLKADNCFKLFYKKS